MEQAWFDDAKLAELPSSIRESIAAQQAVLTAEVLEVEVIVSAYQDLEPDVIELDITVFVDGETRSVGNRWTEYHRLLGDGQSETVTPALVGEQDCSAIRDRFLFGGSKLSELPGNELPDGPSSVTACLSDLLGPGNAPPSLGTATALSEETQVIVDAYNALPPRRQRPSAGRQ